MAAKVIGRIEGKTGQMEERFTYPPGFTPEGEEIEVSIEDGDIPDGWLPVSIHVETGLTLASVLRGFWIFLSGMAVMNGGGPLAYLSLALGIGFALGRYRA